MSLMEESPTNQNIECNENVESNIQNTKSPRKMILSSSMNEKNILVEFP